VQILRDDNWDVDAIDLPSTGATGGLAGDADAVTAAIERAGGPVVLVGHSYGGVPITQAGGHPSVERLVYVAAFALDVGESAVGSMGGVMPDVWGVEDGQVTLGRTREERVDLIASDMPPGVPREVSEHLADLFRPQSLRSFIDELTEVAWRSKPTTYILTENDGILPPPFQESLATRSGADVIRVPHGHAPFQEDPASFAALLARIATSPAVSL
jgi:pimeloyl-ACP methyl ester carboxylesterase